MLDSRSCRRGLLHLLRSFPRNRRRVRPPGGLISRLLAWTSERVVGKIRSFRGKSEYSRFILGEVLAADHAFESCSGAFDVFRGGVDARAVAFSWSGALTSDFTSE
jgi:hypothetical protein